MLHATDDDPAGLKAAGRDYWLLTARGIDVRKLILTDGEQAFNDPADAYSAAPTSLAATLAAVDIAPPLAAHLIADSVSRRREQLSDGNLYAIVGTARELGTIIAAAPADQRAELMVAAAAMLADCGPRGSGSLSRVGHDDDQRGRPILGQPANSSGSAIWSSRTEQPSPPQRTIGPCRTADADDVTTGPDPHGAAASATIVQQVHERLTSAAAALATLRHSTDEHDRSASTDSEHDNDRLSSETASTREQHSREEDLRRGVRLDDSERER